MANNTPGQGGDGESEWIFEINEDEILRRLYDRDIIEDDESTRNINVDEILRGLFGNGEPTSNINEIIVISSDSEEDELISHSNETIVISSDSEDDDPIVNVGDEPISHGNEIIVISSDSEEDEPIPNINDEGSNTEEDELEREQSGRGENQNEEPIPDINDEGSNSEEDELEHEQTGRGEKRKAENQNVEQEQDYYQIKPIREHHSQKFNMTAKNYGVHFNNALDDVDLLESRNRTYGIFQHLIEDVTKDMNPNDQVRFVLSSNQLQSPISIPFCSLEELTVEKVLSHVEKVVQSNEDFRLNTTVNIDVIRVEMPQGSGRFKRTTLNIREHLKKKRTVIPIINNNDNLCLARALAVSIARIEKDPRYERIRRPDSCLQRERAFDLHEAANVPLGPCGLKEVKRFQHYLVNYQIIVVSGDQDNAIIYPREPLTNPNPEKSIYLYYQANHFDVITKLPGFLNTAYFCHVCHKGYDHTTDHLCDGMCRSCRGFACVMQDDGIECNECDRLFKNQACYDRHKQEPVNGGGRTVCETVRKCLTCQQSMDVRKIRAHECVDNKKCPTCKIGRNPNDLNHQCYMQQLEPKEESSYTQLLFFDFECTQEHGIHEVNLCVVYDEEGEVAVFQGKNTVKDFLNWLITPQHHECIVIAHNFQGYDSYPILKHLHANTVGCEAIYNGAKCVTLKTKVKKKPPLQDQDQVYRLLEFHSDGVGEIP